MLNIITQKTQDSDKILSSVDDFYSTFNLSSAARKSNMTKMKGIPFRVLFTYLICTIFSNQSAYRNHLMNKDELSFSDKTFRNLLNDGRINWSKFMCLLSSTIWSYITPLTSNDRKSAFVIDDTMYVRENAKKVELAAMQHDHATKGKNKYKKGFKQLMLGITDGATFLPVNFSLQSGKNKVAQAKEFDGRSNAFKRRAKAQRKATDVAIELLQEALKYGVKANYVLFDSWFSSPVMLKKINDLKLFTVCMLKKTTTHHYLFEGKMQDVKTIFSKCRKRRGRSRYLLSVEVMAVVDRQEIPVKLVYVRNRNKRNEYLVLASTDIQLTENEIIELYGKRWSIEVYFKMCKSHLRLGKYQGISYDGIFAHSVIVMVGYMILAVKHRQETDDRTIGDLFYLLVTELSDISFAEAIQLLLNLFRDALESEKHLDEKIINGFLSQFLEYLPAHYKNRFIEVKKTSYS